MSAMQKRVSGAMGVLAAIAVLLGLAGCAASPARVPTCSGNAVPINLPAATGSVSSGH